MPRLRYFIVSLLALCLAVAPDDLRAIVYGFPDTDKVFRNTGALIVRGPSDGPIFPICSGALIAPTVFLTASHCTLFFERDLAPLGYSAFVSFDSPIPFGDLTSSRTKLAPAVQVISNPGYNQSQNDPEDIAVVLLRSRDTNGIDPAALPSAGLFDSLAARNGLQNAVFTPVGYGLQNRVVGGGPPFFQDRNPLPRMYAFSPFDSLTPAYIRLSQNFATGDGGTCYGDSGGPNFFNHNGRRILASITITGDAVCRATSATYRLDIESARRFLSPFVALP